MSNKLKSQESSEMLEDQKKEQNIHNLQNPSNQQDYGADSIKVLKGLEAVRKDLVCISEILMMDQDCII